MKNLLLEMMADDKTQPDFCAWTTLATRLAWVERVRQNVKFGDGHFDYKSDERLLAVLTEEVGEIARAILDGDEENKFEEIVQVCAVALAWVEKELKMRAVGKGRNETSDTRKPIPCSS